MELNEVISSVRKLTDEDILGPKERDARRKLNVKYVDPGSADKKQDYSRYFLALEQKLKDKRVSSLNSVRWRLRGRSGSKREKSGCRKR